MVTHTIPAISAPAKSARQELDELISAATLTVAEADEALQQVGPMPYGVRAVSIGERTIVPRPA